MSELYYKKGAKDGRNGIDPEPPSPGLGSMLAGAKDREVEEWARDYTRGHQAGSQQRLADKIASSK